MAPPTTHPRLILATANPHKVEELRSILGAAVVGEVLSLADLCVSLDEPAEIGNTFEANAAIKALSYARQIAERMPSIERSTRVLADDSGIEIDALSLANGNPPVRTPRPGVISSHYCTDGREADPPMSRAERDAANNARVLRELEGVPAERRTARFVCVMALAGYATNPPHSRSPSPTILHLSRGEFEGRVGIPPRVPAGANGFGYDPLFLVAPGCDRTGAELKAEEKNRLSHRARAAAAMAEWLRSH